jgi:hypothetical protein
MRRDGVTESGHVSTLQRDERSDKESDMKFGGLGIFLVQLSPGIP